MLTIEGLGKRYGDTVVFHDVTLSAARRRVRRAAGRVGRRQVDAAELHRRAGPADQGRVVVDGIDLAAADDDTRARLRRARLGFVFQAFHVLPHLTWPRTWRCRCCCWAARRQPRAGLLDAVGLGGLGARMPAQLSGGQLQRVAIARAVVHRPGLILADEPTGNLDPVTANRVLDLLVAQVRDAGAACLLVTHSEAAAARADRVLSLAHRRHRSAPVT
jgi:putative ABC transport system ATP-binding protein